MKKLTVNIKRGIIINVVRQVERNNMFKDFELGDEYHVHVRDLECDSDLYTQSTPFVCRYTDNGYSLAYKDDPEKPFAENIDGFCYIPDMIFLINKGSQYGFYNLHTKRMTRLAFDAVYATFEDYDELQSYFFVKEDGLYRIYNAETDSFSKVSFEDFEPFVEGVGPIKIEGKWGILDCKDNLICPPNYEVIDRVKRNFFLIDEKMVVSKKGNIIISDLPESKYLYADDVYGYLTVSERKEGTENDFLYWDLSLYYVEEMILMRVSLSANFEPVKDDYLVLLTEDGRIIPERPEKLKEMAKRCLASEACY